MTSARAGRCSTRRAPPGGPRGCARSCPAPLWATPHRLRSRSRRASTPTVAPPGVGVPVAGAALPLGAARLVDVDAPAGRDGRRDGALRSAPCLELIERHRVTHAQFVPTMFVRMLRLPQEERERYDLSSLRYVVHAAAPCPVEVKRQMIELVGPDHPRVLRRHRGHRQHLHLTRGVAGPSRLGGPPDERVPHRRGQTARSCRRARPVSSTSPAVARSSTTTTRTRPRRSPTTGDGARSATSGTSTRTATSTSPTARPT